MFIYTRHEQGRAKTSHHGWWWYISTCSLLRWSRKSVYVDVLDGNIFASYFLSSFPIQHLPSALYFHIAFFRILFCSMWSVIFLFFPNAWWFNDKSFFFAHTFCTGFKMFIQRLHKCMHTIICMMWKNNATVKPSNHGIPKHFWQILQLQRMHSHNVDSKDASASI